MKAILRLWVFSLLIMASVIPNTSAELVRIGTAGLSGEFLPLLIAQDKGIFKKYGLQTEVITFQSGPLAVQALISGSTRFHAGGTSSSLDAQLQGANIETVAVFVDTLPYTLVSAKNIKTASQLKGARFAVSRIGSVSDLSLRIALRKLGINPEKEAVILGIGDQTSRFGALKSGAVDASVISPPLTITAKNLGYNLLTSFQEAGIKWAYDSIDIQVDFGEKNPQTVLNVLRGFIEGNAYMRKNKEDSMAVLGRYMRLNDREALEETYNYLLRTLPKKPYASKEGMQAVLDAIARRFPEAKTFKAKVNMSYLQELDQSGFIDQVFGK
jgi:NitT/TauT family transport system substrate-binding protein